ncbi:hypothetical protein NM688_g8444 [Phlebia brevispora]|uniref:Uncharacterized protein n=1 Tax=Phlebia brevispora TaxID=194682 RepID=A0ACC1RT87_9APHY|nr:hypothetical protein NM688_g8444 [Phlebia brevispora]
MHPLAAVSSRIVPPQRGYPFYVTAKRYAFGGEGPHAVTLLLLHSTSFHKEVYEPTLEELAICLQDPQTKGIVNIKEAWVIECPNHGESAILNQELLKQPQYEEYFSCERYAEAAYHFLTARDTNGLPYINCPPEKLVGVGHSLGGVSMVFLSRKVKFASLVIVDPFLFPGEPEHLRTLRQHMVCGAYERRDVWATRDEARDCLKKKKWDRRVLDLYVKYAVREHPAWNHPSMPYRGFSLACTREQEATMYRDPDGATKPIPYLRRTCTTIPVHVAFGKKSDIIPRYVQENLVNSCHFASVTWLSDVGHLVPQHSPHQLAQVIHHALVERESSSQHYSKL